MPTHTIDTASEAGEEEEEEAGAGAEAEAEADAGVDVIFGLQE